MMGEGGPPLPLCPQSGKAGRKGPEGTSGYTLPEGPFCDTWDGLPRRGRRAVATFTCAPPPFRELKWTPRVQRCISTGLLIVDSTPARASVPDCGPFPWPSPTWADLGPASRVGFLLAAEIFAWVLEEWWGVKKGKIQCLK